MQPTFAPWLGYFELMSKTDVFIFLDDVEYSHQSWQSRNWFHNGNTPMLLSIPIHEPRKPDKICNKKLHNHEFHKKKMGKRLKQMYPSSEKLFKYSDIFNNYFNINLPDLASKNIYLIKKIAQDLEINASFYRSSKIPVSGSKSDYVNALLNYFEADTYIAAKGSKVYMEEFGLTNFVCKVEFFDYPRANNIRYSMNRNINYSAVHHILLNSKCYADKMISISQRRE